MTDILRQHAIALYDRFTHDGTDRRAFMADMVKLAGSVAAADLLIAGIAASPAVAAIVGPDDPRLAIGRPAFDASGARQYRCYAARPAHGPSRRPAVLVIHENRGLNAHIEDVTRRLALAGFTAIAPDLLSPDGGTPRDEDKAREMIGKIDLAAAVEDMTGLLALLGQGSDTWHASGKTGAIGFCWGGGFVNRLAVGADDKLDAGVVYYGPAPDASEAAKVQAPLLIHDAGLDERVNRSSFLWVEALRAAHKPVRFHLYEGVNHAFNNDTSAERYNEAAAAAAWKRTVAFLRRYLSR